MKRGVRRLSFPWMLLLVPTVSPAIHRAARNAFRDPASPLIGRSVELKISLALIDLGGGGLVATSLPPIRRRTIRLSPVSRSERKSGRAPPLASIEASMRFVTKMFL